MQVALLAIYSEGALCNYYWQKLTLYENKGTPAKEMPV